MVAIKLMMKDTMLIFHTNQKLLTKVYDISSANSGYRVIRIMYDLHKQCSLHVALCK